MERGRWRLARPGPVLVPIVPMTVGALRRACGLSDLSGSHQLLSIGACQLAACVWSTAQAAHNAYAAGPGVCDLCTESGGGTAAERNCELEHTGVNKGLSRPTPATEAAKEVSERQGLCSQETRRLPSGHRATQAAGRRKTPCAVCRNPCGLRTDAV